jgi:acetyl esterase/lipase
MMLTLSATTQPTTAPITGVPLRVWRGEPPRFVRDAKPERDDGTGRIWNVSVPGVLVYLPTDRNLWGHRTAIIACPGGGYTHLTRLVGADGAVATFVPMGVVVVSLKYRLEPPSTDVEADARADLLQAVRTVRHHAADWGVDPNRIGVLGWSAGANACLNGATRFDRGDPAAADPVARESARPDFAVLLSPWPHGHDASAYPVPANAPPVFICSARDDHTAPVAFAQAVAAAFQKAGVATDLWLVDTGGHAAFTLGGPGDGGRWPDRFLPWLRSIGKLGD